jgi:CRISPR/Cas system CMR-associated protein Cmr5 small subunit
VFESIVSWDLVRIRSKHKIDDEKIQKLQESFSSFTLSAKFPTLVLPHGMVPLVFSYLK